MPRPLRELVRAALPDGAAERLIPLQIHRMGLPDNLIPLAGNDIGTALGHLADQSADAVAARAQQFCEQFHGHLPAPWQRLVDQPARYRQVLAGTFTALWQVYQPIWRRAQPVLWRETERIGTAVVTGTPPVALAVLGNHCWRVRGEWLDCVTGTSGEHQRHGRRLVLTPLISGATAASFSLEHPDRIELAYPAPGLALVLQEPAAPRGGDPLAALIGAARARILRHCALNPTMTEVAALLSATPATATHHCRALEAAELIERRRQGRQVRLHRTARGEALLDLFS